MPRALASGSSGSSTSVPGSGAFEWSTPADAQTKPCRVSAITSGAALAHDPLRLAQHRPRPRAGRARRRQLDAPGRRPRRPSMRTTRPSAFETAFCATTTTSPSSSSARPAISAARSSPAPDLRQAVRPGGSRSLADAADADAGVRLVAAVQVHDHGRQPSSARALASGPASSARPRDELRRRARARAPSRRRRRRRRARPRRAARASRFARGDRVQPGDDRRLAPDPGCARRGERASGSGRTPMPFEKRIALATESSGVDPSAAASRARVSSAASAFDREHDEIGAAHRVLVRRAGDAPPPSSAAVACARSASREPITTSSSPTRDEPRRERPAEAGRCRRGSRPSRRCARGVEHVAGEPPRAPASVISVCVTTAPDAVRQLDGRVGLVDHERVDQARVAGGDVRRATCRRRAVRACGRPGP